MNYSEKYYKELLILKETKDFLLEEIYDKSRIPSNEYNPEKLKSELNKLNSLFELNRFARSIAQDNINKKLITRNLVRIQHGYLFAFCEYIGEPPIGSSYIDNTGEEGAIYSYKDAYISSRDAIDEIVNELKPLGDKQKTVRLEEILRENIYKASSELSNSQIEYYDEEKESIEIKPKLSEEIWESRIHLYNRFIADLLKELYSWFDLDLIDLVIKSRQQKLADIFNVGGVSLEHFKYLKELVIKERELVVDDENSEDLDATIDNIIKIPKKPKLTKENQPILTQEQIVILFCNLKKHKVINSTITKTMLGYCIAMLVGYASGEAIRQEFSDENYTAIVGEEKNRKEVILALEKIIDELKKPLKS